MRQSIKEYAELERERRTKISLLEIRARSLKAAINASNDSKSEFNERLTETENNIHNLRFADRKMYIVIYENMVTEVRANFTANFEIISIDLDIDNYGEQHEKDFTNDQYDRLTDDPDYHSIDWQHIVIPEKNEERGET